MAAATSRGNSVVFVGNIPYHASEEELRSVCEEIGPVVSLRVATDRATGRRRGFAFAEYLDDETALSACRNLDGRALRGRDLRVRLADRQPQGQSRDEDRPVGVADAAHAATLAPPGARPTAAVTAYLAEMTPRQLREMLDMVDAQDAALVDAAKRDYGGFATFLDQARLLLGIADAAGKKKGGARKRYGKSPEPEEVQEAHKLRRLEDGSRSVAGVACR